MWCLYITGILVLGIPSNDGRLRRFPDYFNFGASTSAYQIEGGWNADDKGENIWDYAIHKTPWLVNDRTNGDVAADSYHLYKRDVEMLSELGVDFYRFSLAWTRILPTGFIDQISEDGIKYYNNVINELLARGIEPMVTLYHWDLPQSLQDLGGWTSSFMAEYFEDFARVAFDNFGDRVKTWITFNEPMYICLPGYGGDLNVPVKNMSGLRDYLCSKTVLIAHAKAYRLYHEEYYEKFQGRVGVAEITPWAEPEKDSTQDDAAAAETYYNFQMPWFTDPIYTGDYPQIMKELVAQRSKEQGLERSRLPVFTEKEKKLLKGTCDFFGITHYITHSISAARDDTYNVVPSFYDDMKVQLTRKPNWASGHSPASPEGFRATLNWVKNRYNNPEILVLENGRGMPLGENSLIDDGRIEYHRQYLDALLDAIQKDGVNVTHYAAWSLMDNFEWQNGYMYRFGFYEVDFNSPKRTRTARKSALVYKEIIKSRVIDYNYEPKSLDINSYG